MRRSLSVIVLLLLVAGAVLPAPHIGHAQGQVYADPMDAAETGLLSTDTFDPTISFAYQNGQFVVDVQQPSYNGVVTSTVNVPEMADSQLTVDAMVAGTLIEKFVFAGCRHSDAGNGYGFGYWPGSGETLLWREDAGAFTPLDELADPVLIVASGTSFQLGITCTADTITGSIAGRPVVQARDTTYATGWPTIGIGAQGQQTDGLTVAFDNLTVTDRSVAAAIPSISSM